MTSLTARQTTSQIDSNPVVARRRQRLTHADAGAATESAVWSRLMLRHSEHVLPRASARYVNGLRRLGIPKSAPPIGRFVKLAAEFPYWMVACPRFRSAAIAGILSASRTTAIPVYLPSPPTLGSRIRNHPGHVPRCGWACPCACGS